MNSGFIYITILVGKYFHHFAICKHVCASQMLRNNVEAHTTQQMVKWVQLPLDWGKEVIWEQVHLKEEFSIFILYSIWIMCVCSVAQSYLTLCNDHTDCRSPPGSSVHGISQARTLEWVALSSSRGSSWPKDRTRISCISRTGRQILYHCTTWETQCE